MHKFSGGVACVDCDSKTHTDSVRNGVLLSAWMSVIHLAS